MASHSPRRGQVPFPARAERPAPNLPSAQTYATLLRGLDRQLQALQLEFNRAATWHPDDWLGSRLQLRMDQVLELRELTGRTERLLLELGAELWPDAGH